LRKRLDPDLVPDLNESGYTTLVLNIKYNFAAIGF
jgi:hypothetical protein